MPDASVSDYTAKRIAFLRDIPLFADLDFHSLGHIATLLRDFRIDSGDILIQQGAEGERLYLISEGRLEVSIAIESGESEILGEIAAGEIVGEKALLTRETREATVRSTTPVRGFSLTGGDFISLVNQHPDEMKKVTDLIARRHLDTQRLRYRPSRERVCEILARLDIFSSLKEPAILELEPYFQWKTLIKGEILLRQGEPGTSLYVVVSGRLGFEVMDDGGGLIRSGNIQRGSVVGESALLTQEPRNATVTAVRNCELLTLPPYALTRLVMKHPRVLLEVTRKMAARLKTGHRPKRSFEPQSIAVIPLHSKLDVPGFCESLISGTPDDVKAELILSGNCRTGGVPSTVEGLIDSGVMPVSVGESGNRSWNEAIINHSDRILLLADPSGAPDLSYFEVSHKIAGDLIFVHRESIGRDVDVSNFLTHRSEWRFHHIRTGSEWDFRRVMRFLTGRSIGLALSGGGARGLAHIGVVRALREAGIPIDIVTGTSIGALVGAAVAMELSEKEMVAAALKHLVKERPLLDPALPLVSVLKGRKITAGIRQFFGDARIEDFPLSFSAVTTDLVNREISIRTEGPVWKAIRSSIAIPGLIPPVYDEGRLLADGGLLNNAPSDIAASHGADYTILIDVSGAQDSDGDVLEPMYRGLPVGWSPGFSQYLRSRFSKNGRWSGIGEVMLKSLLLGSYRSTVENSRNADCYLRLPVQDFSLLDFKAIDALVELGYRSTLPYLDEWELKLSPTVHLSPE